MSVFNIVHGMPTTMEGLSLITYAICDNGIFLIRKAGCGIIVTKADGIPGIGKGPQGEYNTVLPVKIPFSAYHKTVEFFREVLKHFSKDALEAFVLVLYHPIDKQFKLFVPTHKVSGGKVSYDIGEVWNENPGYKLVMDIHSHHNMGAYFSSVDDKDDNRDRYSAVIGKLSGLIPDIAARFSTLGRHINVEIEQLFENNEIQLELDIPEALAKIEIIVYQQQKGFSIPASGWGSGYGIPRSGYGKSLLSGFRNMNTKGKTLTDLVNDDFDDDDCWGLDDRLEDKYECR